MPIDPITGMVISGVASIGGSLLQADATRDAQKAANLANERAAARASTDNFTNYLISRGINPGLSGIPGTSAALEPFMADLQAEFNRVKSTGLDKRTFQQWLSDFLRENPSSEPARALENTSVNTTLPLGFTINEKPAEKTLYETLIGLSPQFNDPTNISVFAGRENVERFLAANPNDAAEIAAMLAENGDPRSPVEWTMAHIRETEKGNGEFSTLLREFATGENAAIIERAAVPEGISNLQDQAETFAGGLFDGSALERELAALLPVEEARLALAEIERDRLIEQRERSADILNTESAGLEDLLRTRLGGADEIMGAERDAAGRLLGARTSTAEGLFGARNLTAEELFAAEELAARDLFGVRGTAAERQFDSLESGARGIYDADLNAAAIYDEATQLAVQDAIGRLDAQRARQGFAGGGSGDDLMRARVLAEGFNKSAGQRGEAGQSLAQRLAAAGAGRATDLGFADVEQSMSLGNSGVSRAGLLGDSRIGRATDLGFADVENAGLLGRAGVTRATSSSTSREANSAARMAAQVENARRLAMILDADGEAAVAGARLGNLGDRFDATQRDFNRTLENLLLPNRLFESRTATSDLASGRPFTDLDQVLDRLGNFRLNQSAPPAPVQPDINPVITTGQVAGSGLGALGSIGMDYFNTKSLINTLNRGGSSTAPSNFVNPFADSPPLPTNTFNLGPKPVSPGPSGGGG
jgi:hypothetical protein